MIQLNDIATIDVAGLEWFQVIKPRKYTWKLFYSYNVIPCSTTNYLIRNHSERYTITSNINIILHCFAYFQITKKTKTWHRKERQRRNWGTLCVTAPPSRKNLFFWKEFENQIKLYIDRSSTPVLALFCKTLL